MLKYEERPIDMPRNPRKMSNELDDEYSSSPRYLTFSPKNEITKIEIKSEKNEEKEQKYFYEKEPENKTKIIKISKNEEIIPFFIKAKGYKIKFYEVKKDTKIKNVIEDYIEEIKGKKDLFSFTYDDIEINDINNTINDLNIKPLGFILSKK